MGLTNIKAKNQGFTIVELLIVVVVIAILAAITIVSYNGITNRANASAAKSAASIAQKKAEVYANETGTGTTGTYPLTFSVLTSAGTGTSYSVAGVSHSASAPTSDNGKNTIRYHICGRTATATAPTSAATITAITGAQYEYFDYETPGTTTLRLSSGQTSGTLVIGAITHNISCWPTAS